MIAAPYLRVLRAAVELAGGETALAAALAVAPETLRTWLAGDVVPPVASYITALEMVERARANA